jgi:hypothetical protein
MTTVIEKLTPSWKEFKNYLKHKRKEMRVEDLILRLKIREDTSYQKKESTLLVPLKQILWHKCRSPTIKNQKKKLVMKDK